MKHNVKVTAILLAMFFVTQLIGLAVINAYTPKVIQVTEQTEQGYVIINKTVSQEIPYGMEPPEIKPQVSAISIITAILLAALLFFLLIKIKSRLLIKGWFFFVVLITTSITLTALLFSLFPQLNAIIADKAGFSLTHASLLALAIALVLTFYKVIKRNLLVHNFTELLIYPGLAAIFVPILNVRWAIILLFAISLWDMYAVWASKFMVNLAKYQVKHIGIFTGFFLPYIGVKTLKKLRALKKLKELKRREIKKVKAVKPLTTAAKKKVKGQRIRVSLAILGGGDVAFPLIFAGVMLRAYSFTSALIVTIAVTLSLLFLFIISKKERFYPAMPFLTIGCIVGYLISCLVHNWNYLISCLVNLL